MGIGYNICQVPWMSKKGGCFHSCFFKVMQLLVREWHRLFVRAGRQMYFKSHSDILLKSTNQSQIPTTIFDQYRTFKQLANWHERGVMQLETSSNDIKMT